MIQVTLEEVFQRFHIVPKDVSLYEEAFTHASYTNEHKECKSYDRLEFLGDSLLDRIVGDRVYHHFPNSPSGTLSKARSALVEGRTLTALSEDVYGFASLVRYSEGEKENTRFHTHIDEDVFESFIAAVYLDQGYEFVRNRVIEIFTPRLEQAIDLVNRRDAKSRLQEVRGGEIIQYIVVSKKNIEDANSCHFVVEARCHDLVLGCGEGHNTKEAEVNAAQDALNKKAGNGNGSH